MIKNSIPNTIAEFIAFAIGIAGFIAIWFVTPAHAFDRWEGNRTFERQAEEGRRILERQQDEMTYRMRRMDDQYEYDMHERMHDHNYLMNNGY